MGVGRRRAVVVVCVHGAPMLGTGRDAVQWCQVWCVVCGVWCVVLHATVQGASNDDCTATTTTSCLLLSLTTNQVYYVQVAGYAGATGSLGLVVVGGVAPNDNFARWATCKRSGMPALLLLLLPVCWLRNLRVACATLADPPFPSHWQAALIIAWH